MNILFVVEHISTGGMPQYLCYCVKKLKEANNKISAIIYKDIAPAFRVQKDRLAELIPENIYILHGTDYEKSLFMKKVIESINPDVVHLQEFPEISLPQVAIDVIYSKDRRYKIVETSHDSGFKPENKRTHPDGFSFISNFHPQLYKDFGIPWRIVEYPVEYHDRPDRKEALKELNCNPDMFHVLNVGLFTPRKNQGEIFEIARKMQGYPIQFHFVGNQAGNFEHYWAPLMQNKPDNCVIWGERNDADKFYASMNAFLFASKGTVTDLETNPLVLKEALGWHIPILMRNLPVYGGMYDKYPDVYFIDDDLDKTCEILNMVLNKESIPNNLRLRGFYSPSAPTELKVQARVDENPNYTRVYFIPNKNLKVVVALYDYKLDCLAHEFNMEVSANCEYYVQVNSKKSHFTGITLRLLDKLGGNTLFEKSFDFGNRFDNIIFNKNVKISSPPNKRSWFAYEGTLIRKEYERGFVTANEGDICLDLGANFGFAAFYCLDKGASKVYSVEPDPEFYNYMKKNVEGFPVIPIYAAIAEKTGEADLSIYLNTWNCPTLTEIGDVNKDVAFQVVKVPALSFNDLIKKYNIERVNFLKCDIEGAEYDTFLNANQDYLRNNVDKISMELHIVDPERDKFKKEKLIQLFKDCGFQMEVLEQHPTLHFLYAWKGYILDQLKLEIQARVDENPDHTRVYFTPNKDLKAVAVLYDYKLNLLMYDSELTMAANNEYWVQMNAQKRHLTGVTLRLLEELGGKILFEQNFDFGNEFDNIIFSKNIKVSAPSKRRSWFFYYENLIQKTYQHQSMSPNEGDICLDLGASLGFATFYMLDCGASKVYSVEPDPEFFAYMKKNVEGFPVIPIHAATSGSDGEADFNIYLDTYNCSALNTIGNIHKDAKFQIVKVPILSFNSLVQKYNIEKINFFKCDIEGSEYDVFFNANLEYLKNNVDKIAMETHIVDQERDKPKKEKLIQLLRDCGFCVNIVNPESINSMIFCWKENQI